MFATKAIYCALESVSGQLKDYKSSMCCFSDKNASLIRKDEGLVIMSLNLTCSRHDIAAKFSILALSNNNSFTEWYTTSMKYLNTKIILTLCVREKQPFYKCLSLFHLSLFLYIMIPIFRFSLPQLCLNYHPVRQLIVLWVLRNRIKNKIQTIIRTYTNTNISMLRK